MAISVRQIRSEMFKETLSRSLRGKMGVREYTVTGAVSLDEVILQNCPGIPVDGQPWATGMDDFVCVGVSADWWTHNRESEMFGTIKVSAQFGPPELAVLNGEPAPRGPGERWTVYDTDSIQQEIMYVRGIGGGTIQEPVNNGRGISVNVGILKLEICKTFERNSMPDVGAYIGLSRPPCVNNAPFQTPPIFGRTGTLNFGPGQLLYQGHKIDSINGLNVVKHTVLASNNWHVEWVAEDDKGIQRASYIGDWTEEADFGILL